MVAWAKKNGELPAGRCSDTGYGLLVITAVQTEDSGTYVCTATLGSFQVKKELELQVEGACTLYIKIFIFLIYKLGKVTYFKTIYGAKLLFCS